MRLRALSACVALLLLAAHLLRMGDLGPVLLCLALMVLAFVQHPWARRTLQAVLALGALEWVRVLLEIRAARVELGQPWLRMAAILATVALFTLASAWWVRPKASVAAPAPAPAEPA